MGISELLEQGPSAAKFWRRFYEAYGTSFGDDPFPFLNLGYLNPGTPRPGATDPMIAERLSERLYDRVLAGADPADGMVLEVGCGRGGGCARIARGNGRAHVVGLDRSSSLIEWCTDAYAEIENLSFREGDALSLPFPADAVALAVNVESSHCYPSKPAFFHEVARVLAPGGRFAYADIVLTQGSEETPAAIESQLEQAGLAVLDVEDITPGVLEARRAVSRSRAFGDRLAGIVSHRQAVETFRELYFMEGSDCYARLSDGAFGYWRWTAAKP